jgi:hypothetical protein
LRLASHSSYNTGHCEVPTPFSIRPFRSDISYRETDLKFKLVLALFTILLGTPVYAQIEQSLCVRCLTTAKEELKKCLDEAISQEDNKSCQEKQTAQTTTCENGECKIERAAQSGNNSESLPAKK